VSATLADDDLLIVRTFDAPPATVFSLWSEERHFKRWIGPGGFDCPNVEIDFRVGGAYRAMIRSTDDESWFGGVYREIEPSRRLVFTFAWDGGPSAGVETLVTITFAERDGKTVQTFHQTRFLNAEARDRHIGGWTSCFDKAEAYARQIAEEQAS
jgi:uncharacterized protein YndB with AHSA1/START domain